MSLPGTLEARVLWAKYRCGMDKPYGVPDIIAPISSANIPPSPSNSHAIVVEHPQPLPPPPNNHPNNNSLSLVVIVILLLSCYASAACNEKDRASLVGALQILRGCNNLSTIYVSKNFFGEALPNVESFEGFQNLQILALGGCQLTGQIPNWLKEMTKLEVLDLSLNKLTGSIPDFSKELIRLPELSSQPIADLIDLSYVEFPLFVQCKNAFNLQYNRLAHLPLVIYLRNNSLTSNIPVEIGQMKFIHILDLGGQFDTFSSPNYEGNPGLCSPILQCLCFDSSSTTQPLGSRRRSPNKKLIVGLLFGILFVIGVISTVLALCILSNRRILPRGDPNKVGFEPVSFNSTSGSSIILVDEMLEAHVADCGLSRLILPFQSHVTTSGLEIMSRVQALKNAARNEIDQASLASLSLNISNLNWPSSGDCCSWEGVECNGNDGVTRLWLPRTGLHGFISPSFSNLTKLTQLNLSHNCLSGPLPDGFFSSFTTLQIADLSFNCLFGPLTISDTLPIVLQILDLSSNCFNGLIQSSFLWPAMNLRSFNVSNNSFTGRILSSICSSNSLSLVTLDFSYNGFHGPIRQGFGACEKLEVLRAGFNFLRDLSQMLFTREVSEPFSVLP
ncbi:hypothetical protein LguiB_021275 [Lonicera macranthoides]